MKDDNILHGYEENISSESIDTLSFLDAEDVHTTPVASTSFGDIRSRFRNNVHDVTVPFPNLINSRNDVKDWREALIKFKTKILNAKDNQHLSNKHEIDTNDRNQYNARQDHQAKQPESETHDELLENRKITVRSEGILQKLKFPQKKITTYGRKNTLDGQIKKTNLIKVCVDDSKQMNIYSLTSQYDPVEFCTKLSLREFIIVRNTSDTNEGSVQKNCYLDDGLAPLGTYQDFIKNIPIIQYFLISDCLRNIEKVDSYENFVKDFHRRPKYKLFGVNCSLLVSANLLPL